jgi:hypothetical protein
MKLIMVVNEINFIYIKNCCGPSNYTSLSLKSCPGCCEFCSNSNLILNKGSFLDDDDDYEYMGSDSDSDSDIN